ENSRKILKQVLKGIRYMHSRDVIHRDLKPDNIFLGRDDNGKFTVKIGDFGLSRSTVDNAWHDMDADNHAVTAAVVGVDCCYTRGV
ncbi:protein kinase, partial [Bacillus thuringiensis]|nr:protein kinase [Bacillus thuringiensis]